MSKLSGYSDNLTPTPINDAPPAYTAPVATVPSTEVKGVMGAFEFVFGFILCWAVLGVLILYILSIADGATYGINVLSEQRALDVNPNMYIKDSQNFNSLMYATDDLNTEPFNIYYKQIITTALFNIITLMLVLLLVQACVHFSLGWFKTIYKSIDYDESPILKNKIIYVVLVVVIFATLLSNLFYNMYFIKLAKGDIVANTVIINKLASNIYDNITSNEDFLNAIKRDDIKTAIDIINTQGRRYDEIGSMIFTLSLFNYFKISSNRDNFSTIQEIFSKNQKAERSINPVEFMLFKQPTFIDNMYPLLIDSISGEGKVLNSNTARDKVSINTTARINTLNSYINDALSKQKGAGRIYTYIIIEGCIGAIAFAGISYGIYKIFKPEGGYAKVISNLHAPF